MKADEEAGAYLYRERGEELDRLVVEGLDRSLQGGGSFGGHEDSQRDYGEDSADV